MFRLTPTGLVAASLGLAASDIGTDLAHGSTFPGGPLDETAHALTTLLVIWACGPRVTERLLGPAIIASVAIDLDHVPDRLGAGWLTAGTPRPYPHSLTTIAALVAGGWLWRRHRRLLHGVAAGLAIHFWRDLGESRISLLWPFSDRGFRLPHVVYVLVMLGVIGVDAYRCRAGQIAAGSRPAASPARR
jgi:hypothetical protein